MGRGRRPEAVALAAIAILFLAGCAGAGARSHEPSLHGMRTVHVTIT